MLVRFVHHWPSACLILHGHAYIVELIVLKVLRVVDHRVLRRDLGHGLPFVREISDPARRHGVILDFYDLFVVGQFLYVVG